MVKWFYPAALLMLTAATPLNSQAAKGNCVADAELIEMPPCAVQHASGRARILPSHLATLNFDRHGLAPVYTQEDGWMYVNRAGWSIVTHVAFFDNGADFFHHGLVRVAYSGKWGLADRHGHIAVPMLYDGLLDPDSNGIWLACTGCTMVKQGEYSSFQGGDWVKLDRRGKLLGHMADPTPATR
jgi:hypothetical protein